MPSPLDSCRLKVERAKEHRDALQKYLSDTFAIESNRPRLGIRFEPNQGDHVLFVNYMPELGDFLLRCSIIFGDAVHNLISALDHLSYQLALLHTGGSIQKPHVIQFPICDSIGAFNDKRKRLAEINPAHVAIMERFQGYHRIDEQVSVGTYFHPLSKLRDLASADKHRLPIDLVIPTSGFEVPDLSFLPIILFGAVQRTTGGGFIEMRPAELGAEVMRARLPAGVLQTDMNMGGYIAPTIAIEGDRSAIAAFDKINAMVVRVIREFEPFF
jgi:hypothetical protein